MKKLLILFLVALASLGAKSQTAFSWVDSLAVSTSAKDTTFSTEKFESATLMFKDCDGWVKFAISSSDTLGWSAEAYGKKWLYLPEGSSLSITANKELRIPGLYRVEYKGSATGTLFIFGTKKERE